MRDLRLARFVVCATGLVASSIGGANLAEAQTVRKITDDGCRCRIRLETVVELGSDDRVAAIESDLVYGASDSRGRYYLTRPYGSQIQVFGPRGDYVRTIGRKGQGPGEFGGIARVIPGPGDSLFIIDSNNRRLSVFSPSYQFAHSQPLPIIPEVEVLRLDNGDFVFNASVATPAAIGQPLHHVSATGVQLKSFGSATGVYRPDVPYLTVRVLARSTGGRLWSAHVPEYVVDRIDPASGSIVETLRRDVSWFPSGLRPQTEQERDAVEPKPAIVNLREDAGGLLWVVMLLPDARWKGAVVPRRSGQPHGKVTDPTRYYDTVIEVIDLKAGRSLASTRLDETGYQFLADNLIGGVVETANGHPRFRVLRVQLQRP